MSAAPKLQPLDEREIESALEEAHIPSLMAALVHLTGDASHISDENKPVYEFFGDGQGNIEPAMQEQIRADVKSAYLDYARGTRLSPPPSHDTIRRMMDFVAGAQIPERYVRFLKEELGIAVEDTRVPHWDSPRLKQAAAKMKVIIVGAGLSGLLSGIRLSQAGVPFEIILKNSAGTICQQRPNLSLSQPHWTSFPPAESFSQK